MTIRRVLPLLFVLATACSSPDSRQKALKTSLTALNAARDGFVSWDKAHQQQIVADAETYEAGKKALEAYRHKRESIVYGFSAAYSALAAAALDNTITALVSAAQAAHDLYGLIKSLTGDGVDVPAVPDPQPESEVPPVEPVEPTPPPEPTAPEMPEATTAPAAPETP